MSLMNDALRKKKRETKHPPATDIFKDGSRSKQKNPIKTYGILAIVILACAVAGFYAWEYFSFISGGQPPLMQPLPHEEVTEPKSETIAVVQENETPPIPAAEDTGVNIIEEQQTSKTQPTEEKLPQKPAKEQPTAPEIVKAKTVEKQKPKPVAKEEEPSLPAKQEVIDKSEDILDEIKTIEKESKPEPTERESLSISQLDPVEGLFYQKAVSYHRQDDLETAIRMYHEVLQKNPQHNPTRFNLSSAYLELGAYSEASPFLEKLHEQKPDDPDILLNLAIAEIGLEKPDLALTLLDRAEQRFGAPTFEVPFHKGVAYSHKGEYEKAIEWYQRAERLQTRNPRLLLNKAIAYDHLQKYADALAYYQMLSRQDGTSLSQAESSMIEKRIRVLRTFIAQKNTQTDE